MFAFRSQAGFVSGNAIQRMSAFGGKADMVPRCRDVRL